MLSSASRYLLNLAIFSLNSATSLRSVCLLLRALWPPQTARKSSGLPHLSLENHAPVLTAFPDLLVVESCILLNFLVVDSVKIILATVTVVCVSKWLSISFN